MRRPRRMHEAMRALISRSSHLLSDLLLGLGALISLAHSIFASPGRMGRPTGCWDY
ncbi:hypothetical protein FA13DRAFT_1737487 [Coprinellus micaceus]|uniref:Uncharacterized protein n=1 Tax=Coprinellus micaceus TaxID=71717 RepID=A0A4Y7SWR5_COPMI|nr:hypothetical protein FA13DRAFT_1737487 [Coprinellus micaceus]